VRHQRAYVHAARLRFFERVFEIRHVGSKNHEVDASRRPLDRAKQGREAVVGLDDELHRYAARDSGRCRRPVLFNHASA
jgi:hypothetical protein